MKIKLLIFGILIHGLSLLWVYDIYGRSEISDLTCPNYENNNNTKRLILAFVRRPNQKGPLSGFNQDSFIRIPSTVFIGNTILADYYHLSNPYKTTLKPSWTSQFEDYEIVFDIFNKIIEKLENRSVFILLVFYAEFNERENLYFLDKLGTFNSILNGKFNDTSTKHLLYYEEKHRLFSLTNDGNELARHEDLIPLISTLLSVNLPLPSLALLPTKYLDTDEELANGVYCNALNIMNLSNSAFNNTGILKYFINSYIKAEEFKKINSTILKFLKEKNHTSALYLSKMLQSSAFSSYIISKQLISTVTYIFVMSSAIGWVILLCLEYIQVGTTNYGRPKPYIVHILYICASLTLVGLLIFEKSPNTYHFYLQMPVFVSWLLLMKFKYVAIKVTQLNITKILLFILIIVLSVEYVMLSNRVTPAFSLCLIALLPCLPNFRQVPLLFTVVWFILSSIILSLIFYPKVDTQKFFNFSATIWLLLAGVTILWVQSKREKVIISFLTVCLAVAIWLQNDCFSLSVCNSLFYCYWSLFIVLILPFFGKTKALNKVLLSSIAFIVPVFLTSTSLEPLAMLLLLGYTASWALIECYYSESHWDNLRRMFMIIYLFILSKQLISANHLGFKCLLCEEQINTALYIYLISLLRQTIIYSSLLMTYSVVLGSQRHGYSSAVLAAIVLSMASIRALIPFAVYRFDSTELYYHLNRLVRINTMSIIFILSYSVSMVYARNHKHQQKPTEKLEF